MQVVSIKRKSNKKLPRAFFTQKLLNYKNISVCFLYDSLVRLKKSFIPTDLLRVSIRDISRVSIRDTSKISQKDSVIDFPVSFCKFSLTSSSIRELRKEILFDNQLLNSVRFKLSISFVTPANLTNLNFKVMVIFIYLS